MTRALENSSWTAESLEVLERACDHFGGFQTWRALHEIRLHLERLSGLVPWLKGNGRTFVPARTAEIRPHQRWMRFLSYPDSDHVGIVDVGFFARGAHFWQRQTRFNGFPIALSRHVTLRL